MKENDRKRTVEQSDAPGTRRKDPWEKLQALSSLLTAIVVAVLGYFLHDSVSNALKREELQLSNVKEMRDLVAKLQASNTTADDADVAAWTLSAFGRPAVGPLVTALCASGEVRGPAAEKALRAVGLSDPEAVCEPTIKIVDNRTGRFSWLVHLSAIRLIGDLDCPRAKGVLHRYRDELQRVTPQTLPSFARTVDSDPPVDMAGVEQLKTEIARAFEALGRSR